MRVIDADALENAIVGTTWYHLNSKGSLVEGAETEKEALYKAEDIYTLIANAPTVTIGQWVQETPTYIKDAMLKTLRPKAEWIINQTGYLLWAECNQCHTQVGTLDMNYCPNCGAEMGGVRK